MQVIKKIKPFIKLILLFLLIGIYVRSGVQQLSRARQLTDTDGAYFAQWEKRFEPIKDGLPFKFGVIGYIAGWDLSGASYDQANSEAELILTQYTMTPTVVSRGADHEWTLVNLNSTDFDTWFSMQRGEYTVTKYKFNLYLVHKIK